MSLEYFVVEALTAYRATGITQALESLHEIAGHHYEAVADIEGLIADTRGNDEDF